MEKQEHAKTHEMHNPMFTAVRTSRRRSILTTLIDRATVMSEQALARNLAASDQEISVADVSAEQAQDIRMALRHTHLPLLEDSGFLKWDREEETITTTDHRAVKSQNFQQLLEIERDGVDEALSGLSNKHRRFLLAVLREDQTAKSKTALARETI